MNIVGGELLLGCYNILLQKRILQMKLNQTPNMTLYLVLTDFDIFKSIMEKMSTWRSDVCVYFGIFFMGLFKVLKIVWSC